MTTREMHYDFKTKLNKVDSQQNRNLLVPEIDWVLNEAMNAYVRAIIQPKYKEEIQTRIGYEFNQRTIDDIRGESDTLTKTPTLTPLSIVTNNIYTVALPPDYMFYLQKSYVNATKKGCTKDLVGYERQTHSLFEESSFDSSNFEWRESNIQIKNNTIHVHTDGTFIVNNIRFSYFTKLPFIHNAQDFTMGGGQYYKPDGTTLLTGTVNCPLPSYVHYEIVDLAVAFTAGNLQMPDYRAKLSKMELTQ